MKKRDKSMISIYVRYAIIVCVGLFMLGVGWPWLFSQPHTELVLLGWLSLLISLPVGFFFIRNTVKKTRTLLSALLGVMIVSACSKVPAGYVGIKVYLLGSDKGVDVEELKVGRYWIGINEELYLFPTFTQNYVWTRDESEGSPNDESITFQTKEGLSVNADVGISYHVVGTKASSVFQKYRKGIGEITDIYLRNMTRDAFNAEGSKRTVESVYGEGKTELLATVEEIVRGQVDSIGIVIERVYLIGSIRLPESVILALNLKIEANQRAEQRENELREAIATAQKNIAAARGDSAATVIRAKSEAEAIKLKRQQLNSLIVQYESVQRWNGSLPQVTGTATPFVDLRK